VIEGLEKKRSTQGSKVAALEAIWVVRVSRPRNCSSKCRGARVVYNVQSRSARRSPVQCIPVHLGMDRKAIGLSSFVSAVALVSSPVLREYIFVCLAGHLCL